MSHFSEWTLTTDESGSVSGNNEDLITGWIEGFIVIAPAGVSSSMTGTLTEVGGLQDTIWSGDVGNGDGSAPTITKYPVHDEVDASDADALTKGKFYLSQQNLNMALATVGATPNLTITIRVKYIPDRA